jgi:negative regulator of flagellin synthesis FlgM
MDGIDTSGIAASGLGQIRSTAPAAGSTPAAPVAPVAPATTTASAADAGNNLISLLADAAPPIDSKKVEAIQSLIAAGAYPIDPHAIAAKMLALDFPSGEKL